MRLEYYIHFLTQVTNEAFNQENQINDLLIEIYMPATNNQRIHKPKFIQSSLSQRPNKFLELFVVKSALIT